MGVVGGAIGLGLGALGSAFIGSSASKKASQSASQAAQIQSDAAVEAAKVQAAQQQKALDYLQQQSELPTAIRDEAMQALSGLYGINVSQGTVGGAPSSGISFYNRPSSTIRRAQTFGGVPGFDGFQQVFDGVTGIVDRNSALTPTYNTSYEGYDPAAQQQEMIDLATESPIYESIMGGQKAGEEAIIRNMAATGGLRSGNIQEAMYDYNTQLQNQALLEAYNQQIAERERQIAGLQSLAGLSTPTSEIAGYMSGIGSSEASGILNAGTAASQGLLSSAQIQQAGTQQTINNLMGLASLGIQGYGAGLFSDRRLKDNIHKIGKVGPFNLYEFTWSEKAEKMGLKGTTCGVMADEIYETHPALIEVDHENDVLMVRYGDLFEMVGG